MIFQIIFIQLHCVSTYVTWCRNRRKVTFDASYSDTPSKSESHITSKVFAFLYWFPLSLVRNVEWNPEPSRDEDVQFASECDYVAVKMAKNHEHIELKHSYFLRQLHSHCENRKCSHFTKMWATDQVLFLKK